MRYGDIAPLIPNLSTWWRKVASFTNRPLYPLKNPTLLDELDIFWITVAVWTLCTRENYFEPDGN
jgi:hypothetical protein